MFKIENKQGINKVVFLIPFALCLILHLLKINNHIFGFGEIWLVISDFGNIEALQAGHTPYYYYFTHFIQAFNFFNINPHVFLRLINLAFATAALLFVYKTIGKLFNYRVAYWTILYLSAGSFYLFATTTTLRYPLVMFLFFVSLNSFFDFIDKKKNKDYFIFMLSEILVTAIDFHAFIGTVFKLIYLIAYKHKLNFRLKLSFTVVSLNYFITNLIVFYFSRKHFVYHLQWLKELCTFKYFFDYFLRNFFINSLYLKPGTLLVFFLLSVTVFSISKRKKEPVCKVLSLFLSASFFLLLILSFLTKTQFFFATYLIFLMPFWLGLFFYQLSGKEWLAPAFLCLFILWNTITIFPTVLQSGYDPIIEAVEKNKIGLIYNIATEGDLKSYWINKGESSALAHQREFHCLDGFVNQTIFRYCLPCVLLKTVRSDDLEGNFNFLSDLKNTGNIEVLHSRPLLERKFSYTLCDGARLRCQNPENSYSFLVMARILTASRDLALEQLKIIEANIRGYKKVFEYIFADAPGIFSLFLIYEGNET